MKSVIEDSNIDFNQINIPGSQINIQYVNESFLAAIYTQEHQKSLSPIISTTAFKITQKTKLLIKNMVCLRCIIAVKAILTKLELPFNKVELLNVEIEGNLSKSKRKQLKSALRLLGFELMEDKKSALVEKIKSTIIDMIQGEEEIPKTKFSVYLSQQLNHNYTYLSNLFSQVKGITIEHFIQSYKIERVKQLLLYNELTVTEIAWKLQYSSVAHLSNQFKKITGVTPTHFKNMNGKGLISHDNL